MRTIATGLLCLWLAMLLLTGCVSRNETKIAEAQAKSDQARYDYLSQQARTDGLAAQASAAAAEAQARADAQVGVAQANSQVRIVEAQEETERATAWLSILPILLTIVAAAGVVSLWVWWEGRKKVEQVKVLALLPATSAPNAVSVVAPVGRQIPADVGRRARQTGTEPVKAGAFWLLVDSAGDVVEAMEPRRVV